MVTFALNARRRGNSARLRAAELAGTALRMLGVAGKSVPGVLGPIAICVGLGMFSLPLGIIAAGAFLMALDRQIS